MLHISNILTLERTVYLATINSKKKALELIADTFSESNPALVVDDIFNKLVERERLGSTAIGHGVAIPHARLSSLHHPLGCFISLKNGIDFDTEDHHEVNMIFTLVVPEEADDMHIELLATLAHLFSQDAFRQSLNNASSKEDLYKKLLSSP